MSILATKFLTNLRCHNKVTIATNEKRKFRKFPGYFVSYSYGDNCLHLFDINGRLLKSDDADDVLSEIVITKDSQYLLAAGSKLSIRKLSTLEVLFSYQLDAKIMSLTLTPNEQSFFVALETGRLLYFAEPKDTSDVVEYQGYNA